MQPVKDKDGAWQSTNSFKVDDLAVAVKVADLVAEAILGLPALARREAA